jgi:hypothetical protein
VPAAPDPALPGWAHVPGVTPSADHAPLAAAKALVPARFAGPPPADHPALRYAIRLCDAGFYWEAHEVLEAVWMATAHNSRDRIALRAIIQLANAGLKLRMGRALAAKRLLAEVAALLPDATAAGCQAGFAAALDAATLRDEVQWLVAELDAPGRDAVAVVPRIPMHKNA